MDGSVYEYQPSFILGFHGCQKSVGEAILSGKERHLKPSEKKWDWLGCRIPDDHKALGLPDKAQFSPVFLFRLSPSAGT